MFKVNERVRVVKDGKVCYGVVAKANDFDADILLTNGKEAGQIETYEYRKLDPLLNFESDADILKVFCCYEITGQEAMSRIKVNGKQPIYQITMNDFKQALINCSLSGTTQSTFEDNWLAPLENELCELVGFNKILSRDKSIPVIEVDLLNSVLDKLHDMIDEGIADCTVPDLIDELEYWEVAPAELLKQKINEGCATEFEYEIYEKLIKCLCAKGHIGTLKTCGQQAMEYKEWSSALKFFTKLYTMTGDPIYAEKLGIVYMHLRGDEDRFPDYERAFQYFCIASDDDIPGGYLGKAALLTRGLGGYVQNRRLAQSLVRKAYDITIRDVLQGYYDNLFPEAAMKFADLIKDDPERFEDAMRYYLLAKGILLKRINGHSTDDDQQLLNDIDQRISDLVCQQDDLKKPDSYFSLEFALEPMGENNGVYTLNMEKSSNGEYILTFSRAEQQPLRAIKYQEFFMAPDVKDRECYFLKKLVIKTDGADEGNDEFLDKVITFDDSYYDEFDGCYVLLFYGKVAAKIKGRFLLQLDKCDLYEENDGTDE